MISSVCILTSQPLKNVENDRKLSIRFYLYVERSMMIVMLVMMMMMMMMLVVVVVMIRKGGGLVHGWRPPYGGERGTQRQLSLS